LIKTNFSRAADILTSNPAGSFLGFNWLTTATALHLRDVMGTNVESNSISE
jgi:hypothetical protein